MTTLLCPCEPTRSYLHRFSEVLPSALKDCSSPSYRCDFDVLRFCTSSTIRRASFWASSIVSRGPAHRVVISAIVASRALFRTHWRDDSASDFRVFVAAGAAAQVRERIVQRYAQQRQVFVLTNAELRSYILEITNQWFGLTAMQTAVAVLVAVLGIINTLTVSIIDRRREIGVLQAVGALRRQVRRTIWIEAVAVATIGVILGCAFGAINLHYVLDIVRSDVTGMRLDYLFPTQTALMLIPMILGAGFVAAIWPAESAVRSSLVEALEYE